MSLVVVNDWECQICFLRLNSDKYEHKCQCNVDVCESCIIEWIRKTTLKPPQCPWCCQPITDREILNKSKNPNRLMARVITIGSFALFAGAAVALQIYHQGHKG